MRYAHPGQPGALVSFKSAYGNFIDGKFVEPLSGEFFMNTSPVAVSYTHLMLPTKRIV